MFAGFIKTKRESKKMEVHFGQSVMPLNQVGLADLASCVDAAPVLHSLSCVCPGEELTSPSKLERNTWPLIFRTQGQIPRNLAVLLASKNI